MCDKYKIDIDSAYLIEIPSTEAQGEDEINSKVSHVIINSNRQVKIVPQQPPSTSEYVPEQTAPPLAKVITDEEEASWQQDIIFYSSETALKNTLTELQDREEPAELEELLTNPLEEPTVEDYKVLSNAYLEKLKEFESSLSNALIENRRKQENILKVINSKRHYLNVNTFEKHYTIPYFLDKDRFPQPPNQDVILKKQRHQLLPTDFNINSFWCGSYHQKLRKGVLSSARDIKIKEIESRKRLKLRNPEIDRRLMEDEFKKEIDKIQRMSLKEVLVGIDVNNIDWLKISATDLDGKFSDAECKAKWNLSLSPFLNKNKWSKTELDTLKAVAEKYKHQNWEAISNEVGNRRTAFLCCIKYYANFGKDDLPWTQELDAKLINTIRKYRIEYYIPWVQVAWWFGCKTLRQCEDRYRYRLNPNIIKGSFTAEEDSIIMHGVKKFGQDFRLISHFLAGRDPTQARSRFEYLVGIMMPKFQPEEDQLLLDLRKKFVSDWGKVSSFFKDRTALQCRQRYKQLKSNRKYISSNEGNFNINKNDLMSRTQRKKPKRTGGDTSQLINVKNKAVREIVKYNMHCGEYLFGPAKEATTPEEFNETVNKMKSIMSSLSVGCPRPNIQSNLFSSEEEKLIETLSHNHQTPNFSKNMLPPNYNTLTGLNTLLNSINNIKHFASFHQELHLLPRLDPKIKGNERMLSIDAQRLFKERLRSLFALPWLFTLFSVEHISLHRERQADKKKKINRLFKQTYKARGVLLNRIKRLKKDNINYKQEDLNQMILEDSRVKHVMARKKKGRGRPKKTDLMSPKDIKEVGVKKAKMIHTEEHTVEQKVCKRSGPGRPRKVVKNPGRPRKVVTTAASTSTDIAGPSGLADGHVSD